MATAHVLGGCFPEGYIIWDDGKLVKVGFVRGVAVEVLSQSVEAIQVVNEEHTKKLLGAIGMGAVGLALTAPLGLGLVGAAAGVLKGGNKKELTFLCQLRDGRQFLAKGSGRILELLYAATIAPPDLPSPAAIQHPVPANMIGVVLGGDLPAGSIVRGKLGGLDYSGVEYSIGGTIYTYVPREQCAVSVLKRSEVGGICKQHGWDMMAVANAVGNLEAKQMPIYCTLGDGRSFLIGGCAELYCAMRPKSRKEKRATVVIVVFLLLVIISVVLALVFGSVS